MRHILIASPATGPIGPVITHLDTATRITCAVILWTCFLAMLIPTFANAVLRYATNASLVWSVEIVQLTFPWFIMAGAVLAAQHCRHIGVELVLGLVPDRMKPLITIPVQALILLTCGAVIYVYLGFGMFEGGMEFAAGDVWFTSLGVPQSLSYLALLVGYALLGLTAITNIYRQICGDPSLNLMGSQSIS
jgi:TRAP-type C4-dicarboxylate transport system permease small subunit